MHGGDNGEISLTVQFGTGTPPYSYSWTGPSSFTSNSKDIYNLVAGEYICNIIDSNGCQIVAPFNITEPANSFGPVTYTSKDVSCKDGNDGYIEFQIEGSNLPFTFLWSNGETHTIYMI